MKIVRTTVVILPLAGCVALEHKVEYRPVGGRTVEIHTDAPTALEPACQEPWAGCYDIPSRRIFMRSPVDPADVAHEIAHDAGMRHGPWLSYGPSFAPMRCAQVTVAGGKYKVGQMICKRGRGEEVFTDSTFQKRVEEQNG